MFEVIRQRSRDISTTKHFCMGAKMLANAKGRKEPGAGNLVLMALELPDGTARKAFTYIQADPDDFPAAITTQYEEVLRNMGVALPLEIGVINAATPASASKGVYQVQPSTQSLMQTMIHDIKVKEQKANPAVRFFGAHLLLAATYTQNSVAVRAFRAMGVDPVKFAQAAQEEVSVSKVA